LPALILGTLGIGSLLTCRPAHAEQWALVIGIDHYADANRITSLGGATADARALARALQEAAHVPETHIQLLVSDGPVTVQPTRTEILNALTRLAASAKPGDTVFVFYGGHGIENDGTPYLLPYDTSALSDANITDTALETEKFTRRLRQIKARALVLAFDMCRSDPRTGKRALGSGTDNKLSPAQIRGMDFSQASSTAAGATIAITFYSCSPAERSYEDRLQSRGYFSEYLERGLRGAAADATGAVRVASLAKYLEAKVHAAVAQAENGASQTPYPEMKGPGVQEFVLAHAASPGPGPDPGPVPPPDSPRPSVDEARAALTAAYIDVRQDMSELSGRGANAATRSESYQVALDELNQVLGSLARHLRTAIAAKTNLQVALGEQPGGSDPDTATVERQGKYVDLRLEKERYLFEADFNQAMADDYDKLAERAEDSGRSTSAEKYRQKQSDFQEKASNLKRQAEACDRQAKALHILDESAP